MHIAPIWSPNHTPTIADTVPKWLNTPTLLLSMQLLGPLVTTIGRQEGIWIWKVKQDLHGARVDPRPEEASLLQDRSYKSLLQHQSTSQGNMGDSEPPDILCESVLVPFTPIYKSACPFLVKHSTIITSEESLRDSKLPVTGCLRTKGQESVYETCACVIHMHYSTQHVQLATCATSLHVH